MASHYAKMIGLPYLWQTLALPIHELNDMGKGEQESTSKYETGEGMQSILQPSSLEVDPNKLDEAADAAINQLQLMLISQKLFSGIIKSVESMPPSLRQMYTHVKQEVERKFVEHSYKAVAGFLFLRFICPSILAPHVYGLLSEPPNQACQRYLILLSKTLQNLALGTLPGRKEEYMQKVNEFITTNEGALHDFIDTVVNTSVAKSEPGILPPGLKLNSLAFLHQHISINAPLLNRYFDEHPHGKELKEKLVAILQQLGVPLLPKSN
jgi:hypothetical protein